MGNLYVYGCSFSHGHGVFFRPGLNPYFFWGRNYEDWYWGNQIASRYNLKLNNRADGGLANNTTVKRILEDACKFTENDTIVIGITQPDRVSIDPIRKKALENTKNYNNSLFPDINAGETTQFFSMTDKEKQLKVDHYNRLSYSKGITVEEYELLHTSHLYWYQNSEHKRMYAEYYDSLFKDMVELISKLGSKVVLWNIDFWNAKFERIKDWAGSYGWKDERLPLDGHFSPNGNTYLAMEIANALDSGVQIMKYKPREKVWYEEKSSYFKPYVEVSVTKPLI